MREALYHNFSQFGLLYRLHLGEGEEGTYFAYVQVTLALGAMQYLMDSFSVLLAESCKCGEACNKTKAREHQLEG